MCERHGADPSIEVRTDPRRGVVARWHGLVTCGHIWTCPVCSQNLRSKRAEKLAAAVRGLEGRWQMLTVTLRHRRGMPLKDLVAGLLRAWRACRQGGRIQRVWTERVSASARATEVTHGENGWHPHLHVLLRTSAWDDDERDALLTRWQAAITKELGEHATPDDKHALQWSDAFDAADAYDRELYLAKLGLEVAGVAKKGKRGSRTHWDVASDAAAGDIESQRLWQEFYRGTKGRRMLELDDRAAEAARKQLEAEAPDPRDEEGRVEPLSIPVKTDDVRALRWLERRKPDLFAVLLFLAERHDVDGVRRWIAYAWTRWRSETGPPSLPSEESFNEWYGAQP